jgi:lysyl endopeptidase
MKKTLLALALIAAFGSFAQVKDGLTPPNFKDKVAFPTVQYIAPKVDNILEENLAIKAREENQDKVFRFGKELATNISFFDLAEKSVLPNGNRLSQYRITSKGAHSINLILTNFVLAPGATLFLTDTKKQEFIGAYTAINNNDAKVLGTEILKSDDIIVVVEEPGGKIGQSSFTISTVVHAFLDLDEYAKGLNTSGDCNVDVNCPLGQGWEYQRNSVAMMMNGGGFCTGSLVNNTTGTIIPYFMSARHCGTNPTNWVFRFRWEAPVGQTSCATIANSGNGPQTMNVNGATLRADNNTSDFVLVELNSAPNPTWGIYYNGWDNSDASNATNATGIHHPDGDIKKICREEQPLTQTTTAFNGAQNRVWTVADWDYGVTEPGSSGSPLFNQDKRMIGVLSGGGAACTGTTDNNLSDIYGRFGYAWNNGTTPAKRLKEWLDPNNTGAILIDGVDPAVGNDTLDAALSALTGIPNSSCSASFNPSFKIFNTGLNNLNAVNIVYGIDGNYNQTYNWTGNMVTYASATINLTAMTFPSGNHSFNMKIVSANGIVDQDSSNNRLDKSTFVIQPDFNVRLRLELDCYASETSWEIKNANNLVLHSGNGYSDNNPDTIIVDMCLPYGCYNFVIKDSYGDGMTSCSTANGGSGNYSLTNLDNGAIVAQITDANAAFGTIDTQNFCYDSINGLKAFELASFIHLAPNPGTNVLKVQAENVKIQVVEVLSMTGQLIGTFVSGSTNETEISTSNLSPSVYLVRVTTNKGVNIQRWIKQ